MKILPCFLLALLPVTAYAQSHAEFDGSLEKKVEYTGLPVGWMKWGLNYTIFLDDSIHHGGKRALYMTPEGEKKKNAFGSCVVAIPVDFTGSNITLTGYLKLENVEDGKAGLIMRIDGKEGMLDMDNMHSRNLRGTADWQQYRITLPLRAGAKTIYVGAISSGSGKVWADDLEVLVDGKPLKDALPAIVYKADSDTAFAHGSGIQLSALTPEKVHHLEVLGKLWGFLKYYHPAVASGDYNWDYELFRILPAVLNAGSRDDRNNLLLNWVNKLSLPASNKAHRASNANIKMQPDLAWIADEKELGPALTTVLKQVAAFNREDEHYYIGWAPAGNPLFKHEPGYGDMPYPDAGFRLLALFRYWNMIQYFYPYKYLITEGWNGKLAEYIPAMVNAGDVDAYQTTLLQLIADIHDSHAGIYGSNLSVRSYFKSKNLPLLLQFVENKLVVMKVGEGAGDLRKGDVITAVNKEPVAAIVKRLLPTTSASNYATQLKRIENFIFRTKDSIMQLEYERNGSRYTAMLTPLPSAQAVVTPDKPATSWKLIGNDIGYVYPGLFKNTQMDSVIAAFKPTKGMVIDLRCYPSDNILLSLVTYVLPERTAFVKFCNGSIQHPGLFTMTDVMEAGTKNKNYYKGKVVILINASTQSNAEFVTMALRLAPHAVVLGSTTAGADGNVSYFHIPGGLESLFTGIGVYYPDGRETQRVGIIPDIVMEPTVKGIRENRDELLDKALSLIRE